LKALRALVEKEGLRSPYLVSIGERAEAIAQAFQERQATTQETLRQLQLLVQEYLEARERQENTDLSPEAFAIFWLLRREGIHGAEVAARQAVEAFERYPHWQWSS